MIIQLRSTISYDVVGDQVVFLNPDTQAVYSLPLEVVAGISGTTLTLTSETPPSYLSELHEAGLTDIRPSTLSRRKLLAGTGAVAGAGLVAMSMPSLAAASSGVALPARSGLWYWDFGADGNNVITSKVFQVVLFDSIFPEITGDNRNDVTITVDLGLGISVEVFDRRDSGTIDGNAGHRWSSGPDLTSSNQQTVFNRLVALRALSTAPVFPSTVRISGTAIATADLTWRFTNYPNP